MRSPLLAVVILASTLPGLAIALGGRPGNAAEPQWRAGVADVCITPEGSYWMAGYAARDRPSDGTLQDLYAKAIALDDAEGARLVIVTMDLIVIPKTMAEAIYQRVEEKYGLPRSRVLLNCSHTHTGPEVRATRADIYSIPGIYVKKIREYASRLEDRVVEIVGKAIENQRPAQLTVSEATASFAVNRRNNREADVPKLRQEQKLVGPVDHAVPVLRVTDADGKMIAILFGYACHNTVLSFNETSGDYAGVAQHSLEEKYPGTQAMFVMGAGGDQNPLPRREVKYVYEHGEALAAAVERALAAPQRAVTGPLRVARGEAPVQFQPHEDRATLEELAKSTNRYQRWKANFILGELDAGRELSRDYEVPVQVIAFGDDILMVAIGGETVVDYALRVKKEYAAADGPLVWVAGYSNEVFGYLPSLRVLREGGYEGGGAMMYTEFPGPFTETVEQQVFDMIERLVGQTIPTRTVSEEPTQ